ncbi:MAG: hypothetical protein ACKO7W_03010 [Elainella sp.]
MTTRSTTASSNSGNTSVTLSTGLTNALTSLGLQASGFGTTQITNGIARFLITGGAADLAATRVEILHDGGLTLRSGSRVVNLTDFSISNLGNQPVLTGLVTVDGNLVARAPLFNLQIGNVSANNENGITDLALQNVAVTLTAEAAATLNQAFGVTAFQSGFNIGTAQVEAFVETATGNVEGVSPPPIQTEPSGLTSVTLNSTLLTALTSFGVQASGFGGTQIQNGVATFPIVGGAADLRDSQVEINHSGGLSFRSGNTRVTASDFSVTNLGNRLVLTSLISVNGGSLTRAPLFDLQLGSLNSSPVTGQRNLTNLDLQNVALTLAPEAAAALNQAFGVTAFQPGLSIGTAQVDAFVNSRTGDVEGTNPLRVIDVTGTNQLLFTGLDSDVINAATSRGGNRIYSDGGADTLLLGANDRVQGGEGDDRFYAGTGGGNRITGGAGADQFWIANNGQVPTSANVITDFQAGTDVLGVEGLVTNFNQLQIRQQDDDTLISANGSRLAVLENVRASRLSASNFALVGLGQNGEPDDLIDRVSKPTSTFPRNARNIIEVTSRGEEVEGSSRNDLIDASASRGRNRILADRGNDTVVLGQRDQVLGGRGNDRFFVQSGGGNRLTGEAGRDQFWIANGEFPAATNTVTDFQRGTDVIGISGLGVSQFDQLILTRRGRNTLISVDDHPLALLQGITPSSLSASNFAFA